MDRLRRQLCDLHEAVHAPSYRQLERHAAQKGFALPTSTINTLLRGRGKPRWETVEAFIVACQRSATERRPPLSLSPELFDLGHWRSIHESGPRKASASVLPPSGLLIKPVLSFSPLAAGVHNTPGDMVNSGLSAPAGNHAHEWRRSSYVKRRYDDDLRHRLRTAAENGGGLVLLTGMSCSGKTRSAWEAIRATFAHWQVVLPADAAAIRALAAPGVFEAPVVLWLDEVQAYLSAGGEAALTAHDLLVLFELPPAVVVVGTLEWGAFERLTGLAPHGTKPPAGAAVLKLGGPSIVVPDRVAETELNPARARGEVDGGIAAALDDPEHGMTQVLAGAPWLVQWWDRHSSTPTGAVVAAASDLGRLGYGLPVPEEFLRAAAPAYFAGSRPAPDGWLKRALDEAATLIRDAVAPLTPHRDPRDPVVTTGYTVTPYLQQHLGRERDTEVPPAGLWQACADWITDPQMLSEIAYAAHHRGLLVEAEALYRAAAKAGAGVSPLTILAKILKKQDRVGALERMWRDAVNAGYSGAQVELVTLLSGLNRLDEAILEARRGVAAGQVWPRQQLSSLLIRAGRPDEAVQMWKDLVAADPQDVGALHQLCYLLADRGHPEVETVAREAFDSGRAWFPLYWLRERQQDADGARRVLSEALVRGYTRLEPESDTSRLWRMLTERSSDAAPVEIDENPDLHQDLLRRADSGDRFAAYQIAGLCRRRGRIGEAITRARALLAGGYPEVRFFLAEMLHEQGESAEAEQLMRDDVAAGTYHSFERLVAFLRSEGRTEEATAIDRYGLRPDGSTAKPQHHG